MEEFHVNLGISLLDPNFLIHWLVVAEECLLLDLGLVNLGPADWTGKVDPLVSLAIFYPHLDALGVEEVLGTAAEDSDLAWDFEVKHADRALKVVIVLGSLEEIGAL